MGPNDYRHNPFTDTSTAVQVTELHKIPSLSPYTIKLNEVPVKANPSTVRVRHVSSVDSGSLIYGIDFAEVAATPAVNQFFPDYNTAADGDPNWNTGAFLFLSQNAGGLVEITYQARGTLASVRANRHPNQWVDVGDGSNGDFRPTSNMTLSGIYNFKSVIIPTGVIVTVAPWTKIKCQEVCWINGILHANGTGSSGGSGYQGPNTSAADASGVGGAGGGYIRITAKTIIVNGAIQAAGNPGGQGRTRVYGGGGGGGGAIVLIAHELLHNNNFYVGAGAGSGSDGSAGNGSSGAPGAVLLKELGWS